MPPRLEPPLSLPKNPIGTSKGFTDKLLAFMVFDIKKIHNPVTRVFNGTTRIQVPTGSKTLFSTATDWL